MYYAFSKIGDAIQGALFMEVPSSESVYSSTGNSNLISKLKNEQKVIKMNSCNFYGERFKLFF